MILACNGLGAAAVARTQLERWSANRSSSNNLIQAEGQAITDHYTTIWSVDNPPIEAGKLWQDLSELLHGRGPLTDAAHWDASELADPGQLTSDTALIMTVETATQLALRQVLLGVVALMDDPRFPRGLARLLRQFPLALPSEVAFREAAPLLWPLTLEILKEFGSRMEEAGVDGHGVCTSVGSAARTRVGSDR